MVVPHLTSASAPLFPSRIPIYYAFGSLSSYLYQLESLTLDVHSYTYVSPSNSFAMSYMMALNSLNFKLLPSLNTLRSQLAQVKGQASSFTLSEINFPKKARKVKKYPNEHLKEVEIVGFAGREIDIQLVVYLLESAINLEKIIVNLCAPYVVGIPCPKNIRTTVEY
ncbi:hypothetical protein CFP56_014295 [Quercus suber]|uniref:FBD domain-containing protein n=1 Tax=Quercus suber TaxID=58331 RepID=A0AAW0KRV7_QUESU